MKPEFDETYSNPHTDPLYPTQADFNWEELYRRLGEADPDTPCDHTITALRRVFHWLLNIKYNIESNRVTPDMLVGRRLIALAWVINPDLFPNSPSLRQLSRHLGVTAPVLASLTGEVCREFGIQNRAQAHAWNRSKSTPHYAHNCVTAHQNKSGRVKTARAGSQAVKTKSSPGSHAP